MSDRRKVLELFEKNKEMMESRINYGIENYRKGYANITVSDENGNAIPNAKIKVMQKTHEFKYGANLFMLDELETDAKNEAYKKYFAEAFNMATLPFYWYATEPEKGKTRYAKDSEPMYRRPPIDLCMEYCEKNGIEPREHGLAYDIFFPEWLRGKSDVEVKRAITNRCKEISERYADKIPTIEVTNETWWAYDKAVTSFYNSNEFVEWCFKEAEKYFSDNELVINDTSNNTWIHGDGTNRAKYYMQIERALSKGARIDAIGLQYHMFYSLEDEYKETRKYYDPAYLYRVMDKYAEFGKPLQVTEVTIPAYSNDESDEALQAEIIEKLYSIWFSHENVEQIVYWNAVDGYAHVWDPALIKGSQGDMTLGENVYYGGLLRFDLTPKPAYYTIKNLFQKKWHTDAEIVSDSEGNAQFKGFYGKYDVVIEIDGKDYTKEIDLSKYSRNEFSLTV